MALQYLVDLITPYSPPRPLRSSESNLVVVPKCRVRYGERSFSCAGPVLWNALPHFIKSSQSPSVFKQKNKIQLFKEAYGIC